MGSMDLPPYTCIRSCTVLSRVALLSFKAARVPKDKEHPYGHGKFETLGALGISGVLLATARAPEVVNQSHLHMHEQHHSGHHHGINMDHPVLALNVTILSIAVKEAIKRGRGTVGSRMDEDGPYLPSRSRMDEDGPYLPSSPDPREKESASPNMKLSKVHRYHAVIGPEKPDWLNSTGPAGSTTVKAAGSDGLADGNSPGLSRITVDNSVEFTYEELATTTNDQHYILHTFHICQS
ncbi:Metal tolerance protein 2 [Capsicum baccatum]|uniref:Metal tolerance protein 2 n=1 Tax=Capsicum baccatum TaxID=33114 RepID=A0A2G2WIA2_CAPBA|nr:Metal tolerance protein 2 [Capsicum baccatum]